jgi:hypothetical protein
MFLAITQPSHLDPVDAGDLGLGEGSHFADG